MYTQVLFLLPVSSSNIKLRKNYFTTMEAIYNDKHHYLPVLGPAPLVVLGIPLDCIDVYR